jgi:hypothetical protein
MNATNHAHARKYTLQDCPDEILIIEAVRRGFLAANDDWNPTPEEIRDHDTDATFFKAGNPPANQLKEEIARRGLKGRTGTAWVV